MVSKLGMGSDQDQNMSRTVGRNPVKNRNASWVEPLERMLGDGRHYLVVVGALHLVGRDNVIDMLKARGHPAVRLQ